MTDDDRFANGEFTLDPTEIFRTYNKYKREAFGKLIFYMMLFFCKFHLSISARATSSRHERVEISFHARRAFSS